MIGEVTFGIIGLLFLFADVRTFSSTFQQTFFGAPNTSLAVMATAVFATSFLGALVGWRLGPARALGSSGALFAVATFLCTASRNNLVDLGLSVVALAAGFWWLAFLHSARAREDGSPFALALPLAFAADVALRATFRTIAVPDLEWSSAIGIALVAAVLFAIAGLVTLAPARHWTAPDVRGLVGLLVAPALILVAETGATNGAQVAAAAGLGLGPEPVGATQIGGVAVGVGIAAAALVAWRFPLRGPVIALLMAAGALVLWAHLGEVSLVGGGVLAASAALAGAALLGGPLRPARTPVRAVLALSVGWLVFVAGAFGFYAFWAYYPVIWAATAIVAVATLIVPSGPVRLRLPIAVAIAAIAVALPVDALVSTQAPTAAVPLAKTFRLMTYNIHQGFNEGQIPSLDEIARAISGEDPDVILLQEVVRGWMIDEQQDTLSVLADRLGMRYVFMPDIGDLYGDALLSRVPMSNVRRVHYDLAPGIKHQPRGALLVDLGDDATGKILVICTHLDELEDGTFVRQDQVRTIIRVWSGAKPAIVAGDLNATPGAIEVRLLNEAGFDDLGAAAGETTTDDNPPKRIDYVWGVGVVGGQAHVPSRDDAVRASDHRWLVVNITRP